MSEDIGEAIPIYDIKDEIEKQLILMNSNKNIILQLGVSRTNSHRYVSRWIINFGNLYDIIQHRFLLREDSAVQKVMNGLMVKRNPSHGELFQAHREMITELYKMNLIKFEKMNSVPTNRIKNYKR